MSGPAAIPVWAFVAFILLTLAIAVMITLAWQVTVLALLLLPIFVIPARRMGRRIADLRRDSADLVKQNILRKRQDESTLLASTQNSVKELEDRLRDLRHEVERRVKAPGTDLKAAPFQSSAKVITLPAYTEIVIVIVTPHWYGVQTPDGQRGWLPIDQVESLP